LHNIQGVPVVKRLNFLPLGLSVPNKSENKRPLSAKKHFLEQKRSGAVIFDAWKIKIIVRIHFML